MPWIIIQRVTLPLAVFFHFHSAVVFVELFKEVFTEKEPYIGMVEEQETSSIKKNREA